MHAAATLWQAFACDGIYSLVYQWMHVYFFPHNDAVILRYIQSSAGIIYDIVRYCINICSNWGKTSIRAWTHNISPWRASYGVCFVKICEKIDKLISTPHCMHHYITTVMKKNTSCTGPAQWSHTANRCFPAGHLQQLHNLTSVEACQTARVLHEHCQSLDYYGDTGTCIIQPQSLYWSNEDHYCLGSDHYEVLRSDRGWNGHIILFCR